MNNKKYWRRLFLLVTLVPGLLNADSINFGANVRSDNQDFGKLLTIPAGFGEGEFTFELWIKPDNSFPFGPCTDGSDAQLTNWCTGDRAPSSGSDWWFEGNFLLDGHANAGPGGTFSLQFYGGGRLRWHHHSDILQYPHGRTSETPSLVDGQWHHVATVRRWVGASEANYELWVDGVKIAEQPGSRVNFQDYWTWVGYRQPGWYWGAEKQAADGSRFGNGDYEDYKGLVDEVRFWSRAKSDQELTSAYAAPLPTNPVGLVGYFPFDIPAFSEPQNRSCSELTPFPCIEFTNQHDDFWAAENFPSGIVRPRPPANLRVE